MPRRGRQDLTPEEAEVGRLAGIISRADPELFETLKAEAQAKGMKLSEYLLQIINVGRMYEPYKDVDAATIMKVMDILDRMQKYMLQWMSNTSAEHLLNQSLTQLEVLVKLSDLMAPMLGYKRSEEIEELIRKVREEARREVIEQMRKRGIISDVIDKFVENVVQQVAQEAVNRLAESGVLEELGSLVAGTTEQTVKEVKSLEEGGENK